MTRDHLHVRAQSAPPPCSIGLTLIKLGSGRVESRQRIYRRPTPQIVTQIQHKEAQMTVWILILLQNL